MSAALCSLLILPDSDLCRAQDNNNLDLSSISLEQLTETRISSFARKTEDLWLTPAAVFVISRNDIEQSGLSSIPELLRTVPGLQVAQITASYWAVTARGYNSEYAAALLVMIDGRTVYSEIYSGAHWDSIDLPLEQIERIEVIRGPGAAVWGANAVNGVINIITQPARNTTRALISGTASRIEQVSTLGFGGALDPHAQYRTYLRYIDREPLDLTAGGNAFDGASTWRGGGRADWQKDESNSFSASGDIYQGHLRTQIMPYVSPSIVPNKQEHDAMSGGFLLGRWDHQSAHPETGLQLYFDEQSRMDLGGGTRSRTTDIDYLSHCEAGRHDLTWGAGFRLTADHVYGQLMLPSRANFKDYLVNAFLQDEIAIDPQRLTLTLGTKVQGGTLEGVQLLPSVRLLFAPSRVQSFWIAASQAGVSASLQDKYTLFPLSFGIVDGLPMNGVVEGNPNFKTETVLAYEMGYRRRLGRKLAVDIASFVNDNHRIQTIDLESVNFEPTPSPQLMATFMYSSGFKGKSEGIESSVSWKPVGEVTLRGGYAWMEGRSTQVDAGNVYILNGWHAPRNGASATASWQITKEWTANALVSRVGAIETNPPPIPGATTQQASTVLPAYTRLDCHIARKLGHSFELAAGGTNVQSPRHLEIDAGTGYVTPAAVPRSVFAKGTWSF